MLGAVLEVDQSSPYVEGEVTGHPVYFLIDTGATHCTVPPMEVPNLPLLGKEVQVVGISNKQMINEISAYAPVGIGAMENNYQLIICDCSSVKLLGRNLP